MSPKRKTRTPLLEAEQKTLLLALAEGQSNKDIMALMLKKHNRQMDDRHIDTYRDTHRDKIAEIQEKLLNNIEDAFVTTNVMYRIKELEDMAKKLKTFMDATSAARDYKVLATEYRNVLRQVQEEMDKMGKREGKGNKFNDLSGVSNEQLQAMRERQGKVTAKNKQFFKISEL